jgi:N-acetylneuraminic acid mutarotase
MKPTGAYGLLLTCTTLASGLVPGRGTASPHPMQAPVWEAVAPLPHGLAGFAHGVVAARPVVAGGTRWINEVKHTLADTLCYDPAMNRWTAGRALSRRFAFGAFGVHDGQLVLFGGDDGEQTRADGLAGATDRTLPEPVAYAGSSVADGKLYVLGGTPDVRTLARTTDHFVCVDLITGDSAALPPFPGGAVIHVALVAIGADLLAFTGGRWEASEQRLTNTDAAWRYSSAARHWTPIAPFPSPIRGLAACALDERHILLAGGYQAAGPTDACFLYDVVENRYRPLPPLPVAAMLVGLVKAGDFVYAIGGEDRAKHRSEAVYRSPVAALLTAAGAGAPDRAFQP